jgi:hypothetical protein
MVDTSKQFELEIIQSTRMTNDTNNKIVKKVGPLSIKMGPMKWIRLNYILTNYFLHGS